MEYEPEPESEEEESGGPNFIYDNIPIYSSPMEKIPIHPDGLRLWRGYRTEKNKLNGIEPVIKKKEKVDILNKMFANTIKEDACSNILVKRRQGPHFTDESINPE